MAHPNPNDDNSLFSKIKELVDEKLVEEFKQHLSVDEDEKREVEKRVVKQFSEFVLDNHRDVIPPEFVYRASDKALIDILHWKITGQPMPRVKIPVIEYDLVEPGHLSGIKPLGFHEHYFFTHLEKNPDGRYKRQTRSGYWELQHFEDITSGNGVNCRRKEQRFWQGIRSYGTKTKTPWKMYEYKLLPDEDSGWVLCKTYNLDTMNDNWIAMPHQRNISKSPDKKRRRSKSPKKSPDKRSKTKSPGNPQVPQTLNLFPGG